jgi:hypothetical protein
VHTKDADVLAKVSKRAVFVSGGVSCQLTSRIVGLAIEASTLDQHLIEVRHRALLRATVLLLLLCIVTALFVLILKNAVEMYQSRRTCCLSATIACHESLKLHAA